MMLSGDEIDASEAGERAAYYAANPLPDECAQFATQSVTPLPRGKDMWEQ